MNLTNAQVAQFLNELQNLPEEEYSEGLPLVQSGFDSLLAQAIESDSNLQGLLEVISLLAAKLAESNELSSEQLAELARQYAKHDQLQKDYDQLHIYVDDLERENQAKVYPDEVEDQAGRVDPFNRWNH